MRSSTYLKRFDFVVYARRFKIQQNTNLFFFAVIYLKHFRLQFSLYEVVKLEEHLWLSCRRKTELTPRLLLGDVKSFRSRTTVLHEDRVLFVHSLLSIFDIGLFDWILSMLFFLSANWLDDASRMCVEIVEIFFCVKIIGTSHGYKKSIIKKNKLRVMFVHKLYVQSKWIPNFTTKLY